ncbi:MAG: hypothetical protein IPI06_15980 [Gammaproteobacteria bacterium]|nr:hypothetical protein [Gammaproteobacteria bacterium]
MVTLFLDGAGVAEDRAALAMVAAGMVGGIPVVRYSFASKNSKRCLTMRAW